MTVHLASGSVAKKVVCGSVIQQCLLFRVPSENRWQGIEWYEAHGRCRQVALPYPGKRLCQQKTRFNTQKLWPPNPSRISSSYEFLYIHDSRAARKRSMTRRGHTTVFLYLVSGYTALLRRSRCMRGTRGPYSVVGTYFLYRRDSSAKYCSMRGAFCAWACGRQNVGYESVCVHIELVVILVDIWLKIKSIMYMYSINISDQLLAHNDENHQNVAEWASYQLRFNALCSTAPNNGESRSDLFEE